MILEIERGSTRSHYLENLLWKRLWTCRKTDHDMNECEGLAMAQAVTHTLSPWTRGLDSRVLRGMRFVVDKVTPARVFSWYFDFLPTNLPYSFISHLLYIILAIDSVVKQRTF
jgi:hypothetical protein